MSKRVAVAAPAPEPGDRRDRRRAPGLAGGKPFLDPTTKRAFLAAGALAAAVGVCAFVVYQRRAKEEAEVLRVVKMVQDFKSDIEAVVNDARADPTTIEAALARIEREPDKWLDRSTEADIRTARARLLERRPR